MTCTYLTWHVHIRQAMSGNYMRLHPIPTRIDVICSYLEIDVSQWHIPSGKTCMHGRSICASCKQRQPMTYCISHGVCTTPGNHETWYEWIIHATSVMACMHRQSNIGQRQAASVVVCMHMERDVRQCNSALTKSYMHHTWHVSISCGTFELASVR